jgi:hypothetical protein
MRVLVTGGRDFSDCLLLYRVLDGLHMDRTITTIIHGGAPGADSEAGEWAMCHYVPEKIHPADWLRYGRSAGPIRNQEMLAELPDLVVAFPGGRGTEDMVRRAKQAGLEVIEVTPRT